MTRGAAGETTGADDRARLEPSAQFAVSLTLKGLSHPSGRRRLELSEALTRLRPAPPSSVSRNIAEIQVSIRSRGSAIKTLVHAPFGRISTRGAGTIEAGVARLSVASNRRETLRISLDRRDLCRYLSRRIPLAVSDMGSGALFRILLARKRAGFIRSHSQLALGHLPQVLHARDRIHPDHPLTLEVVGAQAHRVRVEPLGRQAWRLSTPNATAVQNAEIYLVDPSTGYREYVPLLVGADSGSE